MLLNILIICTSFCAGIFSVLIIEALEKSFKKSEQKGNERNPTAKDCKLNFCECERKEQNTKSSDTDTANERVVFIICVFSE